MALTAAALEVQCRSLMRSGWNAWGLSIVTSAISALILVLYLGTPDLIILQWSEIFLLIISSILWTGMVYYDLRAFGEMDAGINALLSTARLIFLTLAAIILFAEKFTWMDAFGIALVVSGIMYGVRFDAQHSKDGMRFRAYSLLYGALAILLDKYLTLRVDAKTVLVCSYIIPPIICILLRPLALKGCYGMALKTWNVFIPCLFLYALCGYTFVFSFAKGELWTTIAVTQTRVLFVIILSAMFIRERTDFRKRLVGGAICFLGAVVISLY